MPKKSVLDYIDSQYEVLDNVNRKVWEYAETAFDESQSVKILCDTLKDYGFEVEENITNIPTAFKATYGKGKPVIGILGEFDALSGLSQESCLLEKKAVVAGGNGHGCGHNNLGVAALAGVIGVKKYLEENDISGTIVYFGCPGEEGGSGKTFMTRDGAFDGIDCMLGWHPSPYNGIVKGSTLANYQVLYKFDGVSAHAGGAPEKGRSALDALELMNVGVNFLREHVPTTTRMHYAITDSGGFSPNVVQAHAEVMYLIRSLTSPEVAELYKRVNDVARGAALMTGTTVEIEFIKACSNAVPNVELEKVVYKNMEEIGVPQYNAQELDYATHLHKTYNVTTPELEVKARKIGSVGIKMLQEHRGKVINDFLVPYTEVEECMAGSTDLGDVSWVCPTMHFNAVTWIADTPGHSWQIVTQGCSSIAMKGTVFAGKVFAASAIDLLHSPDVIERSWDELKIRLGGHEYKCPIPQDVKPRKMIK